MNNYATTIIFNEDTDYATNIIFNEDTQARLRIPSDRYLLDTEYSAKFWARRYREDLAALTGALPGEL